jgi:hypothetical protein
MSRDERNQLQPVKPKLPLQSSFIGDHPIVSFIIFVWVCSFAFLLKEEVVCRFGGYARYDVLISGKKVWHFSKNHENEWVRSILAESSKQSLNEVNRTFYTQCDKYPISFAYAEYRDKKLSELIASSLKINADSSSMAGQVSIVPDNVVAAFSIEGNPKKRTWVARRSAQSSAQIPEWLPWAKLDESSYVGLLGEGYLFRGQLPDQYFWVSY